MRSLWPKANPAVTITNNNTAITTYVPEPRRHGELSVHADAPDPPDPSTERPSLGSQSSRPFNIIIFTRLASTI